MHTPEMSSLPTGTVTFLFTDIEGSTKRWEQHPQAMQAAVERHDAILHRAVSSNGGHVFKTMGDAFYASFPTATQALTAAVAAQQALDAEQWSAEIAPIRVRMALHTGTAEARDGDYLGPPLNRIARLLSAAFGGQILLSHATYDLVRESVPSDVTLRDLGEHRLKDLQLPEHVFQVVAPDLAADFPPLKTLELRPNNLPTRQNPLVGREKELATVQGLLLKDNAGLLTLTGPGGVGKTRLALQVAAELIDEFQDGAYFVDMTPIHDPALVASAIAQALGVKEAGARPIADSLKEHLRDRQLLLVLDNFEHLLAAAPLVAELLAGAPRLRVLVTSRAALHLRGEQEFPLPPLQLPDPRHLPPLEVLSQNEAIALFIQRAQLAKPDFALTGQNAPAVVQICARLDGLPLAIELAASRIRLLPPHAMLERLEKRLKLLTGGARDLPSHQQTMRSTIAWSYELLTPEEQKLFDRISVFAGGCTLEAAEAVCDPDGELELDILDGVGALADKSLLREEESRGEVRFSMLETIREFGLERLEAIGEAEAVHGQFVSFFLSLAPEQGGEWTYRGLEQKVWMERLDAEQNNIRVAIEWSLEHDTAAALRFCSSIYWPWALLGYLGEIRKWVERVLSLPDAEGKPGYARALLASGILATFHSDLATARKQLERAILLLRNSADKSLLSQAVGFLTMSISTQEDPGRVVDMTLDVAEEAVALVREGGDDVSLLIALNGLAIAHFFRADYEAARIPLEEALDLYRKQGVTPFFAARTMSLLADIALIEGDYVRAGLLYQESLAVLRMVGARQEIPATLHSIGYVALAQGDIERARELFRESLALHLEAGDKGGVAEALAGFAAMARAEGQSERSILLYGAAKAIWVANKLLIWPAERAEYERNTDALRAKVDRATWEKAWAEGSAMSPEQAVEYALGDAVER